MTNLNLLTFHNEIEGLKKSVLYYLFISRIKDFYKKNGVRLNALVDKMNNLMRKYYVYDDDGNLQYDEVDNGEQISGEEDGKHLPRAKNKVPRLIEGMNKEDYQKEFNELMSVQIEIKF